MRTFTFDNERQARDFEMLIAKLILSWLPTDRHPVEVFEMAATCETEDGFAVNVIDDKIFDARKWRAVEIAYNRYCHTINGDV